MFAIAPIFLLGLSIGSFLNVLIYRIPKSESIFGRSYCDHCKKKLSWYDLIPLLSFVLLKGKCRFCKREIDPTIPIVELVTGLLFVATFLKFPILSDFKLWFYLFFISSLVAIFFIDLKNGIIPDKIVYPMIAITLIFLMLNTKYLILPHLIAGLGAFAFFLILSLITRGRGMGGGDIKLALVLGLVLGFPKIVISLYLAFLTGAISGLILILWKKKKFRGSTIAFGPFLILGALISIFLGDQMVLLLLSFL